MNSKIKTIFIVIGVSIFVVILAIIAVLSRSSTGIKTNNTTPLPTQVGIPIPTSINSVLEKTSNALQSAIGLNIPGRPGIPGIPGIQNIQSSVISQEIPNNIVIKVAFKATDSKGKQLNASSFKNNNTQMNVFATALNSVLPNIPASNINIQKNTITDNNGYIKFDILVSNIQQNNNSISKFGARNDPKKTTSPKPKQNSGSPSSRPSNSGSPSISGSPSNPSVSGSPSSPSVSGRPSSPSVSGSPSSPSSPSTIIATDVNQIIKFNNTVNVIKNVTNNKTFVDTVNRQFSNSIKNLTISVNAQQLIVPTTSPFPTTSPATTTIPFKSVAPTTSPISTISNATVYPPPTIVSSSPFNSYILGQQNMIVLYNTISLESVEDVYYKTRVYIISILGTDPNNSTMVPLPYSMTGLMNTVDDSISKIQNAINSGTIPPTDTSAINFAYKTNVNDIIDFINLNNFDLILNVINSLATNLNNYYSNNTDSALDIIILTNINDINTLISTYGQPIVDTINSKKFIYI